MDAQVLVYEGRLAATSGQLCVIYKCLTVAQVHRQDQQRLMRETCLTFRPALCFVALPYPTTSTTAQLPNLATD
jgi:hypothetical protein